MNENLRRYFYSLMTDAPAAQGLPAVRGLLSYLIKCLLGFFSMAYLCVEKGTFLLYKYNVLKSYRPKCKVISVGNITLGGTGKTPLVIAIARHLRDSGKKVAILSRGYRGEKGSKTSDEVELFRKHLPDIPVFIGRDRVATAKDAESRFVPHVLLLDDGFQHWRLKRDLDIVTINGKNPFGNGRLIPRGILREPESSLYRADVMIVTKGGPIPDEIRKINDKAEIFLSSYEAADTAGINGKKVAMVCAIGDPSSFEDTLLSLGAHIVRKFIFMDHHIYSASDVARMISETVTAGSDTIVTTEKDMVKLSRLVKGGEVKFEAVGIEMKIDNEEKFFGRLDSVFAGKI
ncbi:MAG: tetraacyldisaccharide 4'-kinase [Omnitrophica WOR_2 bacterium RIFCSPHIGHO2_01_FULL_49_10]|nr:MAG: tetraacyldisaccharide 4'-kinase [Omnitrophica WOR_2 bacterium RIFCSPHIGHO2_01_FULL_49_10]